MPDFYVWSPIYNGGEVKEIDTALQGVKKTVVVSRNITPAGEKVTKAKLKCSDEEWDRYIEGGSIRPYPMPEEADDVTSPTQAVLSRLSQGGEINQDMLLELALQQPAPINPPADEEAELTKPVGVK
jgi:hypothetical protein